MASDWVKDGVRNYRRTGRRRTIFAAAIVLVIFVICVFSLSISRLDISFAEALEVVFNHLTGNIPDKETDYHAWMIDTVVINDNAARTVAGVCVGGILAVSGAIMQSATRNPLTDPYTLGISSAALLGVTLSVSAGISLIPGFGDASLVVNAFVFALIPAMVIVLVTTFKKIGSTGMVLIGIALMYVFNAFTTFLKFNSDYEKIQDIYEWSLGTLTGVEWDQIAMIVGAFALLLVVSLALANKINVLGSGDNVATSLGINPLHTRIFCFVLISVATAVAVCFTGTIGFVGLVGPHIARLIVGSNNKLLIPTSALCGALLVIGADCLVRMLPQVLPVGVITALIGSPIFLYFLYKQKKRMAW